ncbi:hypothetical protein [Azospirillum sp. Sh1]|uniref:hypothetical protein n=1 Tax=Azospirillum sp. Sh1 TaxID=2607285 RepID=UPI0011EE4236|nr:hypothetical protein [Azospirillum sp. Sh1]KAA0574460.1 hypothetical protein FZ029_17995 [Azospirillum sp. Sh1]
MKHKVTRFKSLALALKELQPFILNGIHLQTGKGFERMNDMRSREILANLLLCIAVNSVTSPERLTFTSAPDYVGGDGIILDSVDGVGIPTEHVMVPAISKNIGRDAGELILEAVKLKVEKGGTAYAAGKILVVFLFQGAGEWYPNRIARQLPDPLLFDEAWVVGLHRVVDGRYIYNVTLLDQQNSPVWRVHFNKDFDGWEVEHVQ